MTYASKKQKYATTSAYQNDIFGINSLAFRRRILWNPMPDTVKRCRERIQIQKRHKSLECRPV